MCDRRIIGEGDEEVLCGGVLVTLFNHQPDYRGAAHTLVTRAGMVPRPST